MHNHISFCYAIISLPCNVTCQIQNQYLCLQKKKRFHSAVRSRQEEAVTEESWLLQDGLEVPAVPPLPVTVKRKQLKATLGHCHPGTVTTTDWLKLWPVDFHNLDVCSIIFFHVWPLSRTQQLHSTAVFAVSSRFCSRVQQCWQTLESSLFFISQWGSRNTTNYLQTCVWTFRRQRVSALFLARFFSIFLYFF